MDHVFDELEPEVEEAFGGVAEVSVSGECDDVFLDVVVDLFAHVVFDFFGDAVGAGHDEVWNLQAFFDDEVVVV